MPTQSGLLMLGALVLSACGGQALVERGEQEDTASAGASRGSCRIGAGFEICIR